MGTMQTGSVPVRRRGGIVLVAVALLVGVWLLAAAPAAAHALVVGSNPPAGARIARVPAALRVAFSEAVRPLGSGLTLQGPRGQVRLGPVRHPDGRPEVLAATLPTLGDGSYLAGWRRRSASRPGRTRPRGGGGWRPAPRAARRGGAPGRAAPARAVLAGSALARAGGPLRRRPRAARLGRGRCGRRPEGWCRPPGRARSPGRPPAASCPRTGPLRPGRSGLNAAPARSPFPCSLPSTILYRT